MNRLKLKKVVLRDLDDSQLHTLAGASAPYCGNPTDQNTCTCPDSTNCISAFGESCACYSLNCPPPPPDTAPATCAGKTCDGHCC
jgi:hypothetical protein